MSLLVSLAFLSSVPNTSPAPAALTPASQILEVYADSLTSYKASGKTTVGNLRPLATQRGVTLEGALRAAPMLPMHLAGNPFENAWVGHEKQDDLRLDIGTYGPSEVDIALPAPGFSWIVGRSYCARQTDSGGSQYDSDGPMGRNWGLSSQPEIVLYDSATNTEDVLYLVYRADAYVEFNRAGTSSTEYKGKNGAAGCFHYASGSPDTWVYTDQNGYEFTFLGFNTTSGGNSHYWDGQLWKVVDPNGGTAYVGDSSSASTAISSGWDGSGRILNAFDTASRRYTYAYSSVDGTTRLTQVKAETKTGGTWASPTGLATVAKVDYTFFSNSDASLDLDHGTSGDLKKATITQYLDDAGVTQRKERYYRYWKSTYSGGNHGTAHALKYSFDFEGVRAMDWADGGGLDDSFTVTIDDTLKPYAKTYLEYDSSHRVVGAWFNGQCGCSGGGGNGTYGYTYETNGNYSNTSGYTTAWATRTVIAKPDGSYLTQYFDEVGQGLSSVVTNISPTGVSPQAWATSVIRNAGGCATDIRMPDNATAYTHNTGGNPDGAITPSTSLGLVYVFKRADSGDALNFVTSQTASAGTTGSAYLQSATTWDTSTLYSTITDVKVVRPLIATTHTFPTEVTTDTGYVETSFSYGFFSGRTPPLMPESMTTTLPIVTTANNGSNAATTRAVHYRKDGFVDYVRHEDSTVDYILYTNGQETTRIRDADTSSPTPPSGFSPTSTPLQDETLTTYTAQGFVSSQTLNALDATGHQKPQTYRSALADGRMIILDFPDLSTGPTTYYGPVQFRVVNQAGKTECGGVIALSSTTSASTTFVDESASDPLAAITVGSVAQMHTTIFDDSGTRASEDRDYFLIPGSGAGTVGTNFDATTYGYDDAGRKWRVKDPTGTITRSVFDAIGRPKETWLGTNDHSFSGGESSGTDNMVKIRAVSYDSGSAGKNSLVDSVTEYVQDTTTGQRVTTTIYDWRGRRIVTLPPTAPYRVDKYDNEGRVIATGLYSSSSGLVASSDPTSVTSNRMALRESAYDELGRAWKTTRHEIIQGTGAHNDSIDSKTWFDPGGRVIKVRGEEYSKTRYDRLGRVTDEYVLAKDDDSGYSNVYDSTNHVTAVDGDIVLEQYETRYDGTKSDALMSVSIERKHNDVDTGSGETTGALDTNADGDDLLVTAGNLAGRAQITANWYDSLGRVTDTVLYGTNGGSNFDRDGLSVPSRSNTALRTTTAYNTDGTVDTVTDARALVVKYYYDALGRRTKEVKNYQAAVNSGNPYGTDQNITVQYGYTNGLRTSLTAKMPSGGTDQVTTYIYGTTTGSPSQMKVSTGHLLRAVKYPDSTNAGTTQAYIDGTSDADVVSYAYNAQGQATYQKDQAGTVLESVFDDSGRRTIQKATSLGSGIDNAVLRVESGYDGLGRASSLVQYNATSAGAATDGVAWTYDDWGNVASFAEDKDSAVSGGGNQYTTSYTWTKNAPTYGRYTIRKTAMTMPDSRSISYTYSSTGGLHDDECSRVTTVVDGGTTLAQYAYLGSGTVVSTQLAEISSWSRVYDDSTPPSYVDLDVFNRVTTSRWLKKSVGHDFYSVTLGYDRDSNITTAQDNIHGNYHGVGTRWDVAYTMDNVNRLTEAKEGTLSGGSITNTSRDEQWTLSHTGNWDREKLDLNGDGDFVDANELDDTRTHNTVNELTVRDTDTNGSSNYSPTYDAAGNMTDDAKDYKYVYDGWNRLRMVKKTSNSALVAEYRYNGLNHRIAVHEDSDVSGTVDGSDPWYYDAFDERWRQLARYRDTDASPKEDLVPHQAGDDGEGGSSYIDLVICRNKDANTAWTAASDGTLEERSYLCQNWRADVSVVVGSSGKIREWVKYSAYGTPVGLPVGDTDSDGDCDGTDRSQVQTWINGSVYDVRGDVDFDGVVNSADKSALVASTLGRGVLSGTGVANRKGYAGYEALSGLAGGKWLARNRVLAADLGDWLQRDGAKYVDCMSLYEYVCDNALGAQDPFGLCAQTGTPQPTDAGEGTSTGTSGGTDPTDGGGIFDCTDKCHTTEDCPECKICHYGYGDQRDGTPTESENLEKVLKWGPTGKNPVGPGVKKAVRYLRQIMHNQGMDSFHIKICTYECAIHRCNLFWKQKRCGEASVSDWILVPGPDLLGGWVYTFGQKDAKIIQDMQKAADAAAKDACKKRKAGKK